MLKICDECETAYAPDLDRCPHCLATGYGWNHEGAVPPLPKAGKK